MQPGRAPRAARVVAREPDRIVVAPPGPGRLVVADLVYPGWNVSIDGHGAHALADGDLRAVEVPAGAKRVTWTFTPPGVRLGAVVSLIALLAAIGVAFVPWRRARG